MSPRWNRRETNVAQAGFFTVLRSTGWFSALSRPPGGYRYVVKGPATPDVLVKPEGSSAEAPEVGAGAEATAPSFEMVTPKMTGRGLLRLALIALVALGLTLLFFVILHWEDPGGSL